MLRISQSHLFLKKSQVKRFNGDQIDTFAYISSISDLDHKKHKQFHMRFPTRVSKFLNDDSNCAQICQYTEVKKVSI